MGVGVGAVAGTVLLAKHFTVCYVNDMHTTRSSVMGRGGTRLFAPSLSQFLKAATLRIVYRIIKEILIEHARIFQGAAGYQR